MTTQPTTIPTWQEYAGQSGENYERYFVPAIGTPCAQHVLDAAALRPGERVLDVACGTGIAARLAAGRVAPAGTVVGVDPTPPMLEVARRTAPGIAWHEAAAEDLPLPEASFDAVLCSLGLMFFTDKSRALQEVHRVLVPGGRAVLSTPGPTPPLFRAIDEVLSGHLGPEASRFLDTVFSVHDPDRLRGMVAEAGFASSHVEIQQLSLPLPAPADFLWQYVYSTPLAALADPRDAGSKAAMERDVVSRCRPFLDGEGLLLEVRLLVTTARRD